MSIYLSIICWILSSSIYESQKHNRFTDYELGIRRLSSQIARGQSVRIGDFNRYGDFVPHHVKTRYDSLHYPLEYSGMLAYEYRTNAIVSGVMANVIHSKITGHNYAVFVPEIGTEIKRFNLADGAEPLWGRFCYNLPNRSVPFIQQLKRMTNQPPVWPGMLKPETSFVPAGYKLLSFTECTIDREKPEEPLFGRIAGQVLEIGFLSDRGEFIPDYRVPVIPRTPLANVRAQPSSLDRPFVYNIPRDGKKTEPVYEYRSGRLIKGTLHAYGNFEPEVGSYVTRFKDYTPYDRRRIYNLPGVLVKEK